MKGFEKGGGDTTRQHGSRSKTAVRQKVAAKSSGADTPAFFRKAPAADYIGTGLTTLDKLSENDPTFPRKIRLSSRCVGWRRVDLDAWLELKAKQAAGKCE